MADGGDFPGILLKAHEICKEDEWSRFTLWFAKIEHNEVVRVVLNAVAHLEKAREQTIRDIMATDKFTDDAKKSWAEIAQKTDLSGGIEDLCAKFLVGRFRGEW